jgi:hypothetical protein
MDLGPQPPPPLTLTQGLTPPDNPPEKPPEASKATATPKKASKQAVNNPFRDNDPKVLEELHKRSISEAISAARAPFRYHPIGNLTGNPWVGTSDTAPVTRDTAPATGTGKHRTRHPQVSLRCDDNPQRV